MIQVSNDIKNYINKTSRTFTAKIEANGTVIGGCIRKMSLTKGCTSNMGIGSVYSSYGTIEIDNFNSISAYTPVDIYIGCQLSQMTYTKIAKMYVENVTTKRNSTKIDLVGVITKFMSRKYSGSVCSTVSQIISYLENKYSVNIDIGSGLDDPASMVIPQVNLSDYTDREVLGFIAGLYYGYATDCTVNGDILIDIYKNSPAPTLTTNISRMRNDPDIQQQNTTAGFYIKGYQDIEYTYGNYANSNTYNPLYSNDYQYMSSAYLNFSYYPHDTELTLGDFTLEPMDYISFSDYNNTAYSLPCLEITHEFDGGLITKVSATELSTSQITTTTDTRISSLEKAFVDAGLGIPDGNSLLY